MSRLGKVFCWIAGVFLYVPLVSGAYAAVKFQVCGDHEVHDVLGDSRCALISVPLDHDEPEGDTVRIFVREFPAVGQSRGDLYLLTGGPGDAGATFYPDIDFFRSTFPDYNLIVPDHRGTGFSTKLCEPEETQDSDGGLALAGAEWRSCFGGIAQNTERSHAFNMRNAALDVRAVIEQRASQGEIYVYGVSYGTSWALTLVGLMDGGLDGLILDSLTPSPTDDLNDLSHRSQTTDNVGQKLLSRCVQDADCPGGREIQPIYQRLLDRIDAGEPVAGLDQIPGGDLRQFLGSLLDAPAARKKIPAIIQAMSRGSESAGEVIKSATADYAAFLQPILKFKQAHSSIPLAALMSGSEFYRRPALTTEQVQQEKATLGFTSPLPGLLAGNRLPLYEAEPVILGDKDLPPILVLHGTMDPKTPYGAAMRRVDALKAVTSVSVVTVTDAPHGVYFTAKDCITEPMQGFVKDPTNVQSQTCSPEEIELNW